MVDVLLVNPPIARYDVSELAPPLSLLSLAASLREAGRDVAILDLNLPGYREASDRPHDYFDQVTNLAASYRPREIGITSMGVNTHVALLLAAALAREVTPSVKVGGIHASAIARYLQDELPHGVQLAPSRRDLTGVEWWNSPCPQYSAKALFAIDVEPYLDGNPRRLANLEASYGCKYRCSFCYSPAVYGGWRNSHAEDVAADFCALSDLGFRHAFLVGDNLANDVKWLTQLTSTLEAARANLTWNGYATLPDLSAETIERAATAGCVSLYIGIDVVEPTQQRAWGKSFLRNDLRLGQLLNTARMVGLRLTCAFIIDVDPASDYATYSTLNVATRAASMGADIRLSVITPYPQTAFFDPASPMEYSEVRTAILMDLPQVVVVNPWAEKYPAIFPWHSRPTKIADDWEERLFAVHAAQVLLNDGLSPSVDGCGLWRHSLCIARAEADVGTVHKTELKSVVRRISSALSSAA